MVTLLITSLFVIGLLAIAVYFWQKPKTPFETEHLPPAPNRRSLFTEEVAGRLAATSFDAAPEIRTRAQAGDKTALRDARNSKDSELYQDTLELLVSRAEGPQLLALVSFVCRNELPVNTVLAEKFVQTWRSAPDRNSTATMLHISALSDDARTYENAVAAAIDSWRDGRLSMSSAELRSIIEGEFWILSSATRGSGAGFGLKQTLARARRELESARR